MKIPPLRFEPIYQERVWGGRTLADQLDRTLPPARPIGESWDLVDRSEAQSVVATGRWQGVELRRLVQDHGDVLLGPGFDPQRRFPILVKWLDCRERLSLQVHPPASVATELKGEPKTENWYIAAAEPDAALIAGLKKGVTRDRFVQALEDNALESCVHRFRVQAGQSLLVESGRIHAIDRGNLILEIQQNSDTTYRVYDWGRVGLDGKPRQLHVEESLRSIDFNDFEPAALPPSNEDRCLADCAEFRIREMRMSDERSPLMFEAAAGPALLHVVSGTVSVSGGNGEQQEEYARGDTLLLAYAEAYRVKGSAPSVVLVTDRFV